MVRNVACRLMDDPRVVWFRVRVENHESIHNHDAFAQVSRSQGGEGGEGGEGGV